MEGNVFFFAKSPAALAIPTVNCGNMTAHQDELLQKSPGLGDAPPAVTRCHLALQKTLEVSYNLIPQKHTHLTS